MMKQDRKTIHKKRPVSTVNTVELAGVVSFAWISDATVVGEKMKLLNGNYREIRLMSRHKLV